MSITITPTASNKIVQGLLELGIIVHATAKEKGFWNEKRNFGEAVMLIVAELAEAVEWDRKGNVASDHIPDFSGVEEEFADAIIRIVDLAAGKKMDLASALIAKLHFNQNREFMHGKKY